jgi:hypothetical protein
MLAFLAMQNCRGVYSGTWPSTIYIYTQSNCKLDKQEVIDLMIKRFTRHTQIRFR